MKRPIYLFIFTLMLPLSTSASLAGDSNINYLLTGSLPAYSTQYDPNRDAFKDGEDAVALATRTKRRILIELGGDWCMWCHKMDAFLDSNPDIKQKLHQTFVMLKINVSDANDNAEFLKAFPKPLGYPHMYVSDHNGSVLWSKDTADFLANGEYTRESFLAFFKRWDFNNKDSDNIKISR